MDKRTAFKSMLYEAFAAAKYAHDCCFSETGNRDMAPTYAAVCNAKVSAAEAIYWCSPELSFDSAPELFHRFDAFVDEILNDYRTNHSCQWVDIEFQKLRDLYANADYELKIQ